MTERTGSFPFFAISQDLGVPYAEVLAVADFIEKHGLYDPIVGREVYCCVENAVLKENARRRQTEEPGIRYMAPGVRGGSH